MLAKWLTRDCEILFFDEPTRGIDVGAKNEIYKLLRQLAAQGKAIVIISSELPEIIRLCDRVVVMCEGRVTGEVSGADITQQKIMHYATMREDEAERRALAGKSYSGTGRKRRNWAFWRRWASFSPSCPSCGPPFPATST